MRVGWPGASMASNRVCAGRSWRRRKSWTRIGCERRRRWIRRMSHGWESSQHGAVGEVGLTAASSTFTHFCTSIHAQGWTEGTQLRKIVNCSQLIDRVGNEVCRCRMPPTTNGIVSGPFEGKNYYCVCMLTQVPFSPPSRRINEDRICLLDEVIAPGAGDGC